MDGLNASVKNELAARRLFTSNIYMYVYIFIPYLGAGSLHGGQEASRVLQDQSRADISTLAAN